MANFSGERVPEIHGRNLEHIETVVVGQQVDVSTYETDPQGHAFATSSRGLVAETTNEVLKQLGVDGDPTLAKVCELVAQAAIGRLVTGEGFEVRHGRFPDYYERVAVQLRPTEPVVRQAEVTRQQVGEQ